MKRLLVVIAVVLVGWLASGVYFVQPDEQALVRRGGRFVGVPREPGPHWGLPAGVDRIDRVKPREIKRVMIGLAEVNGGEASTTQFLTGDRNLVSVRATVQYTINDPAHYLAASTDPDRFVATSAEAVLAELLAGDNVDRVLTLGKHELAVRAAEKLQMLVDRYGLGLMVRSVDIGAVEPPAEVADAFDRVINAMREREQAVNQAHGFAHRALAEGRGEAQRTIDQGRVEHDRRVFQARGETERFLRLLDEYRRSPSLTATRLYLETMATVLPKLRSKVIVDQGGDLDVSILQGESR